MRHNAYVLVVALALSVIDGPDHAYGQGVSLTLTSPIDVTSGGFVCQITEVQFTCVGVNVASLQWRENERELDNVTPLSDLGPVKRANFFIYRDEIISNDDVVGNITSRLVFNVSDVSSGDRITCRFTVNTGRTVTLNYVIRPAPSAPQSNDYTVVLLSPNMLNITWNSAFTSLHDVTFYRAVITGSSTANCPSTCLPSEPCQCTAPAVGESISINISATNCVDQEGPAVVLQAEARVPSQPQGCSSVPVYNYESELIGIKVQWIRVNDPPEFTTGVQQNVIRYSIVVGDTTQTILATTACPTVNCSYFIPLSPSTSSFRAGVAAMNVFGPGLSCSIERLIESPNRQFTLTISSTNPDDQRVGCLPRSQAQEGFECEFCYEPVSSCVNGPTMCQVIDGQFTFRPPLNELTYCYRAIARISGTSVAVVQGNFSTACPPQSLVTNETINPSLSNGSLTITGGLVLYNGTVEGAVATYQCNSGYTLSGNAERFCQSDGNWNGSTPRCTRSGISTRNIILLVLSVIFWVSSVILTIAETIMFVLVFYKILCQSVSLGHWRHKAIYVVLLIVAVVFVVIVFISWVLLPTASSTSIRNSVIAVAFTFSVLALISVSLVVVLLFVVNKYPSLASVKPKDHQSQGSGSIEKEKIPLGEELYAQPNGQRTAAVEDDEHREGPGNAPKKKNVKVKKKAKKGKDVVLETKAEYDTLMGEGRHIDTLTGKDDAPEATPEQGAYGKLEGKEHYAEPFDSLKGHYEMAELPSGSDSKDQTHTENQVPEYAVVDKKSKRKT